jgi:hypothetical protein
MMTAPEFMTPEDGWDQLTLNSPFGDGRKEIDIFARREPDFNQYTIFIDGVDMGQLNYTDHWYPLSGCLLTAKEISILTPIIIQSDLKPAEASPVTDEEKRLHEWLIANDVYPGDLISRCMIIDSFYTEETDDDDDFIALDEIDFGKLDLTQGFGYKKNDDEEDEKKEWQVKVTYALDNLDNFLLYIDAEWR